MNGQGDITRLLQRYSNGDPGAADELLPLVYQELRTCAAGYLRRERSGHTLQATALVHEAFLRLLGAGRIDFDSRSHFFGLAAGAMRRVLVDYARQRSAQKRGGGVLMVELNENLRIPDDRMQPLMELDEALTRLGRRDPRQVQVVEMRFFGGLTEEEIARVLGISIRTVKRDWVVAKAWLTAALRERRSAGS